MQIEIRKIEPSDVDRIHAINETNVPEVGGVERDRWDALLDDAAFSLGIEADGVLGGFCVVFGQGAAYRSVNYRWFMDRYDDAMYLDRVAFDPDYQGLGLGTRLYEEVDRVIAADHPEMTRLTLEVNLDPPNGPSLAFHTRRGFTEVGRQVTDYGFEVCLMERAVRA